MNWTRTRHFASGVLIAGALVSGGIVGNVLLLGRASHSGDPVGHLSVRLDSGTAAPVTNRPVDEAPVAPTATPTAPGTSAGSREEDARRAGDSAGSPDD